MNVSSRFTRFSVLAVTLFSLLIPFCISYIFYVSGQQDYFTRRDFRLLAGISNQIKSRIDNLGTVFENAVSGAYEDFPQTDFKNAEAVRAKVEGALGVVRADGTNIQIDRKTKENLSFPRSGSVTPEVSISDLKQADGTFWLHLDYEGGAHAAAPPIRMSAFSDLSRLISPFVERDEFDDVLVAQAESGQVIFQKAQSGLSVTTLKTLIDEAPVNRIKDGKKVSFESLAQSSNLLDVQLAGADYKLFLQPLVLSLPSKRSSPEGSNATGKQGERWVVGGLVRADHFHSKNRAISYTILIVFTFLLSMIALSWPFLKLWFMGPKDRLRIPDVYFLASSLLMGSALLTLLLLYTYTYVYLEDSIDEQLKKFAHNIQGNLNAEVGAALAQMSSINSNPELGELLKYLDSTNQGKKTESQNRAALDSRAKQVFGKGKLLETIVTVGGQGGPYPFFNSIFWNDENGKQRIKWTVRNETTRFIDVSSRSYWRDASEGRLWNLRHLDKDYEFRLEPIYSMNTGGNHAVISMGPAEFEGKDLNLKSRWVTAVDTRLMSLIQTVLPAGFGYGVIDDTGAVQFHSDERLNQRENFFDECDNNRPLRSAVIGRAGEFVDARYMGSGHRLYVTPLKNFPSWSLIVFRDKRILRTAALELLTTAVILFILYSLSLLIFLGFVYLLSSSDRRAWVWIGKRLKLKDVEKPTTRRFAWVWPDRKLTATYCLSISVNSLLSLWLGAAVLNYDAWLMVSLAVLLPFLGVFLVYLNLKSGVIEKNPDAASVIATGWEKLVRRLHQRIALSYRRAYVLNIVSLIVLVSVLPSLAFFKVVYNEEIKLFIRHGQLRLAKGLKEREERVRTQYSKITIGADEQTKETFIHQRLNKINWDVYDNFFFGTLRSYETLPADEVKCCSEVHPDSRRIDCPSAEQFESLRINREDSLGSFEQFLAKIRPLYNQISAEMHWLTGNASADNLWLWEDAGPDKLMLHMPAVAGGSAQDSGKAQVLHLQTSTVPTFGSPHHSAWWRRRAMAWVFLITIPTSFVLLYFLARFLVRRVFLLKLDEPASVADDFETISQNLLVLGPSSADKSKLLERPNNDIYSIDLRSEARGERWAEKYNYEKIWADEEDKVVVIDHFEYRLGDPECDREKLRLLEELLIHDRTVVVISTVSPLPDCSRNGAGGEHGKTSGQEISPDAKRWAGIFNSFLKIYIEDKRFPRSKAQDFNSRHSESVKDIEGLNATQSKKHVLDLFQLIKSECDLRPYLQMIGIDLMKRITQETNRRVGEESRPEVHRGLAGKAVSETPGLNNCCGGGGPSKPNPLRLNQLDREELVCLIEEQAHACYNDIWNTCSTDEKLALLHLAQDRLISAKSLEIRRLLRRGLIVRDPDLRLMNRSFRLFVISACRPDLVDRWEHEGERSNWEALKAPLLLMLVSVILFLFVTQRELYESSLAFVTAIGAGIPTLFKLLNLFQANRAKNTGEG